jgi:hypothetical protein
LQLWGRSGTLNFTSPTRRMPAMLRRSLLLAVVIAVVAKTAAAEPPVAEPPLTPQQRNHWAFRPAVRRAVPDVRNPKHEIRNPIDAFILAKLEEKGLQPSPEADRRTLLRRVTFDLTGLPPAPDEQAAFLADDRLDAYERVVDRLLTSPHYGEQWAQHWLDVVRFAETNGYEADSERPHAWRYRDYVVGSFNGDKPFDRFLIEQVAGDLLPTPDADALIATGLHRCGPVHQTSGNLDPDVGRQEVLTEMVNGVSAAFLGLTVGCARCHDHKFDPISAADYYRTQAFFAGTQYRDRDLATPDEKARVKAETDAIQAKVAPLRAKVAALDAPHRAKLTEAKRRALEPKYRDALAAAADKRTPEQKLLAEQATTLIKATWDEVIADLTPDERAERAAWRAEIHALEAQLPSPAAGAWAVGDDEKIPPTYVLKRGDTKRKEGVVPAGYLRVLDTAGANAAARPTRLDLAKWLARPDHPLTARVWVNRLWQHHFGRGLVATPNDFGARGTPPSHPELLDWLATELPRRGWSTKEMHRLMVLSSTYRQVSGAKPQAAGDPENHLLWRMNRRRLEGEALRDALLAVAGTLNRQVGGPKVRVPLEPEVYDLIFTEDERDGLWKVTPDGRQHTRRTLYLFAKRNVRQPVLEAFDQPDTLNPCPLRPVSTFAPQALILMNGPLAQAQSQALAARLLAACGSDHSALIKKAYEFALGRPPRAAEAAAAGEFLRTQSDLLRERLLARLPVNVPQGLPPGTAPEFATAAVDFCLVVINLNEFIYVD